MQAITKLFVESRARADEILVCGRTLKTWPPPRTRQQMKRRFNFITLSASSVLLDLTRRSNPLILWLLYGINQL